MKKIINFLKDKSANTAVVFALTSIAIIAVIGFSIDFGSVIRLKTRLQDYVDAATVAGVSYGASTDSYGYGFSETKSISLMKNRFNNFLRSDSQIRSITFTKKNWSAQYDGHIIKTNAIVNARYRTIISNLIGIKYLNINITSSATSAPPSYVKIIALIDVSGSMSIGASQSDQNTMLSTIGCQFACHTSSRAAVRAKGVKLRIDVVKSALQQMVNSFQALGGNPNQYEFAVYTFDNTLHEFQSPTTNLATASQNLNTLDTTFPYQMGTNFTYSITNFYNNYLPTSYDGAYTNRRKVFVLLFTDGIEDAVFEEGNGNWHQDPNYTNQSPQYTNQKLQSLPLNSCIKLKQKDATVLTLDTEYVIPYLNGDARDGFLRDDLVPNIAVNMGSCATSENFAYRANSETEIRNAVHQMFIQIRQSARLTS